MFNGKSSKALPSKFDEKEIPIPLPKKTNLYQKDMQREIDQGAEMHKYFQYDQMKLKYLTV